MAVRSRGSCGSLILIMYTCMLFEHMLPVFTHKRIAALRIQKPRVGKTLTILTYLHSYSLITGVVLKATGHPGGEWWTSQFRPPFGGEERYLWNSGGGRKVAHGLEDLLI